MSDGTALVDALQPHVRLHRARLRVLAALVLALVRFRTTNLARLCLAMPGHAHESSAYRRLQRFFAHVALDPARLHGLIVAHAPDGPLTLDRTEWTVAGHTHNLLVVGYLHRGVVVPRVWHALGKRGASSQAERIALFEALFALLPAARVEVVLGDREFIGKDFPRWLDGRRIGFVVRIKKNAWIKHIRSGTAYPAGPLFALLGDGDRRRLRGKWTVSSTPCYVTAVREQGSTWMRAGVRPPSRTGIRTRRRRSTSSGGPSRMGHPLRRSSACSRAAASTSRRPVCRRPSGSSVCSACCAWRSSGSSVSGCNGQRCGLSGGRLMVVRRGRSSGPASTT